MFGLLVCLHFGLARLVAITEVKNTAEFNYSKSLEKFCHFAATKINSLCISPKKVDTKFEKLLLKALIANVTMLKLSNKSHFCSINKMKLIDCSKSALRRHFLA